MHLVEYMITGQLNLNEIIESQFDTSNNVTNDNATDVPNLPVEFENIKKYILFNKLKDIKSRVEYVQLDRKNPEIVSLLQFIEIVSLFFNSFTYREAVDLIDTLTTAIAEKLNIKIPKREFGELPIDPNVEQQMNAQQTLGQVPQQGMQQAPQAQQQIQRPLKQQPQQPQQFPVQ